MTGLPRRLRALALAAIVIAPLTACDPCAGVADCKGEPQLNYAGRVVDRETDRPAPGVRVSFVRAAGVGMDPSPMSAVSDADGYFTLRATATEVGWVEGEFLVEPQGKPSYRVAYRLHAQVRGGEGGDLGTLVTVPYSVFIGDVRDASGAVLPGARLDFRWTGGVPATPTDTTVTSDANGAFFIVFRADAYGVIEGEFTLHPPGGSAPTVIPVRIQTSHTIHLPYATRLSASDGG